MTTQPKHRGDSQSCRNDTNKSYSTQRGDINRKKAVIQISISCKHPFKDLITSNINLL